MLISKSTVIKVVGMLVQPRQLVGIGTPFLIFCKATLPAAFAERFVVGVVGCLQRSRNIDPVAVARILASSSIGLAAANGIIRGSNAVLDQAVHLIELAAGNGNGVLHDAPVIGVGAVVGACENKRISNVSLGTWAASVWP